MAATEHDNDDRWQLALDLGREANTALIELRKMVQRGFEDIAREQNTERRARIALEADIKALRATEGNCQRELAVLKADGNARALLMKAIVIAVVLLFIASVAQSALWWYVVTRLFHV